MCVWGGGAGMAVRKAEGCMGGVWLLVQSEKLKSFRGQVWPYVCPSLLPWLTYYLSSFILGMLAFNWQKIKG